MSFTASAATHSLRAAFQRHRRLHVDEGAELAIVMISACFFTVWLFNPVLPMPHLLPKVSERDLGSKLYLPRDALKGLRRACRGDGPIR